jgi:cysteine sulfinate desulfinase/cysteine desulfurase-like protein
LNKGTDIVTIRFSFSKQNTTQEIDQVITTLLTILK